MSTSGGRRETIKLHQNTIAMLAWHIQQIKATTGEDIDIEEMIMYLCKARRMALIAKTEKELADEQINQEETENE